MEAPIDTCSASDPSENLPPKPEEPLSSDCCGSGCAPCVFDIYEEDLRKWKLECKSFTHSSMKKDKNQDIVLSKSEFRAFRIDSMIQMTGNCWLYRFVIPDGGTLGLKTGQHIILRSNIDNPPITNQYTPVSHLDAEGYFDVAIKIYKGGKMSKYVKTWEVGDMVEWKGPFGSFTYIPNKYQHVCMLAAGTGIAPMIQVLHTILNNEEDETRVTLLFSCCTYEDILMKDELDAMKDYWNFSVKYFITKENHGNKSRVRYGDEVHYGRIDKDVLRHECPDADQKPLFLICGTKSFDKDMINHLSLLGHDRSMLFKF